MIVLCAWVSWPHPSTCPAPTYFSMSEKCPSSSQPMFSASWQEIPSIVRPIRTRDGNGAAAGDLVRHVQAVAV